MRVTLATGIPEDTVKRANLGYLAPPAVDVGAWASDPDTLVVRDAGEVLYRLLCALLDPRREGHSPG